MDNYQDHFNSDERELRLLGITFNQIESGVYALILEEVEGKRRLPIVIGYAEAQAIECKLQDVRTPRPLTHDLMAGMMHAFGGRLTKVTIYKLPSGVFAANLFITTRDGDYITIDSRSSDAVALAIRVGAPIFTPAEVLDEAGFMAHNDSAGTSPVSRSTNITATSPLPQHDDDDKNSLSDEELDELIQRYVENEEYEKASELKKILDKRKK